MRHRKWCARMRNGFHAFHVAVVLVSSAVGHLEPSCVSRFHDGPQDRQANVWQTIVKIPHDSRPSYLKLAVPVVVFLKKVRAIELLSINR